jgi:predicted dehydrogenase
MRVIQVGLGFWGASWTDVVRAAPGVELAGVVDAAPAARRQAVEELGLAPEQVAGSLDESLADLDADAVVIVTPPPSHADLAIAALEAGRHVLVEKPLAPTLAQGRSIVAAAERAGRVALTSQNYRFHPPAVAVRETVASGALGELVAIRISHRKTLAPLLAAGDFRFTMEHLFVLDMMIHHVDLLRAITGQEVVCVDARSWKVPDSPFAAEPQVAALLTLESGATVAYEGDWAPRGSETSWNGDWELVGRDARVLWTGGVDDADTGDVQLIGDDGAARPVALPRLTATDRAGALQALRRAVEEGEPADIAVADNLRSLALVLACCESIETGAPVATAAPAPPPPPPPG